MRGTIWRIVEAQHSISTMKLVDTMDEQRTLEELLDASKPPVPPQCAHLHYLLFTPFRYEALTDSRFRRAGRTKGVFYASERLSTATAEIAFWRLLFFSESPGTPWPANPLELTGFVVNYNCQILDLTQPPFERRTSEWTHPTDYGPCHEIADEARRIDAQAIRSRSARDPARGLNVSLLNCEAFASTAPNRQTTLRMMLSGSGILVRGESPDANQRYDRKAFDHDPRIRTLAWQR